MSSSVKYCTSCLYPSSSAVSLIFDELGVCSGCLASMQKKNIDWSQRHKELQQLINTYKSLNNSNYDCIIPVSGGKDSYYQVHIATSVFKLKPLLVTYHGNNYTPDGTCNLERMRSVFNVDHLIFRPSEEVLISLNRAGFYEMGDMNWHAHVGIYTYPAIIAVKFKIPLMIWGEHGRTEVGGMYSLNDYIEMTAKYVREHAARGFSYKDFVGFKYNLADTDLLWLKYPSDDELFDLDIRGIHLNNFFEWKPNENTELMIKLYGWKASTMSFDRTYRNFSNLDDMHENGAHDYLKFIKFGYGRCTDHASKDIRSGHITRDEGIELVRQYDAVRPSDLDRWLQYVSITEDEWDRHCDTLRDPRVWWIQDGMWYKDNLWGRPSHYGKVTNQLVVDKFKKLGRFS